MGEVAQRAKAILVADPVEEARADRVLAEPARPVQRSVGERVDAGQLARQHLRAHDHVLLGGAHAAGAAHLALGEGRDALDEPDRLPAVGDPELAEDVVHRAGQPEDGVQVQDVRVLVGDQLVDVLVEVAERAPRIGWRREGVDQVVEEGGGVPVGEVGVVLDDDVRALGRQVVQQREEPLVRQLGGARYLLRVPVHPLVVVDLEVRSVQRLPGEPRIERCRGKRGEQEQRRQSALWPHLRQCAGRWERAGLERRQGTSPAAA